MIKCNTYFNKIIYLHKNQTWFCHLRCSFELNQTIDYTHLLLWLLWTAWGKKIFCSKSQQEYHKILPDVFCFWRYLFPPYLNALCIKWFLEQTQTSSICHQIFCILSMLHTHGRWSCKRFRRIQSYEQLFEVYVELLKATLLFYLILVLHHHSWLHLLYLVANIKFITQFDIILMFFIKVEST